MELLKLGSIITDEQHRDAVHIAVAPVVAAEALSPGQRIGFIGEEVGTVENPIGIVDPFLRVAVSKGQKFWMFLYPYTITSLRHDWTHPAFPQRDEGIHPSKAWLLMFADKAGISYDRLMEAAQDYIENSGYLCDGGRWEGFYTPDEFWDHYQAVTGKTVHKSRQGSFFSCSC